MLSPIKPLCHLDQLSNTWFVNGDCSLFQDLIDLLFVAHFKKHTEKRTEYIIESRGMQKLLAWK